MITIFCKKYITLQYIIVDYTKHEGEKRTGEEQETTLYFEPKWQPPILKTLIFCQLSEFQKFVKVKQ